MTKFGVLALILSRTSAGLNLRNPHGSLENPAEVDQASSQAQHIGQQSSVAIYRLIARNTTEEKVLQLHAHKRELADNLRKAAK